VTRAAATRPKPATAGARVDGYAAIEDYAAIGDGRTVALVARDGSIDWLPVPELSGAPVFSALLDAELGGRFALAPVAGHEIERAYAHDTNVLRTTFATATGRATVTDALTTQDGGLLPWVELVRSVECDRGEVELEWQATPRFEYGLAETTVEPRRDGFLACCHGCYLLLRAWDAGDPELADGSVGARFTLREGERALLACVIADREPIPFSPRAEVEKRLAGTVQAWRRWADECYDGDWRDAVVRSALALKLLIQASTGAVSAAATSSLPERIGGDRNYDYRYAWIRDSAFTLDALARLGFREQVHGSLSWLLQATWGTHPRMQPFYELEGDVPRGCAELDLAGYRGSRPVFSGNAATGQAQLGNYGDLLETIHYSVRYGNTLDRETAIRVAEVADFVCRVWENEDAGIWELHEPRHYTVSKIGCWVALDRAQRLTELGEIPGDNSATWRATAERVRAFVEERCWSKAKRSYTFYADGEGLDAAVLLAARNGFCDERLGRLDSTLDAVRRELADGPLVYRYSGQQRQEGAFLACSFWLADALLHCGRRDEARALMDELVGLANDVGLYAEELGADGHMLGNFPQALVHLSLINTAASFAEAGQEGER
jgi:GH15 family glucan-1,4-alpha-glucosidase